MVAHSRSEMAYLAQGWHTLGTSLALGWLTLGNGGPFEIWNGLLDTGHTFGTSFA